MPTPFDHCGYCGAAFPVGAPWPHVCPNCGRFSFRNPLPVAVMLVPLAASLGGGLLAVRRGIEPGYGQLALPGGFVDYGEAWQAACAREVFEEIGVVIPVETIQLYAARSTPDGVHLLIFGLAPALTALPTFVRDQETLEVVTLTGAEPLAFTLHTDIVAEYFGSR